MEISVEKTVLRIIAAQTGKEPDAISLETNLESIGLDSLGMVEVIFAIEEAFDISVPFNANGESSNRMGLSTINEIVISVEKLVSEAGS